MAGPSPGVRSSKRERAEVKYYDCDASDCGDESCDEYITSNELPRAKKVTIKPDQASPLYGMG